MAKDKAEYGDEVTVGSEKGFVKGSVGVPGGREVTVLVVDEDAEVRSIGVMESAKYSAANANGEAETRELNEKRWAASAKDNEEADKDATKMAPESQNSEGDSTKDALAKQQGTATTPQRTATPKSEDKK